MIKPGDFGPHIYVLQQSLGQLLKTVLHPSGVYDADTIEAVRKYQSSKYVNGILTDQVKYDIDRDMAILADWKRAATLDAGEKDFKPEDIKGFLLQDVNHDPALLGDWGMFSSEQTLNYSDRSGSPIDSIFLYYTQTPTAEDAVALMQFKAHIATRTSAHFIIDYDGKIIKMVDLKKSAWHSGMRDMADDRSVAIALQNWGPLVSKGGAVFFKGSDFEYDKEIYGNAIREEDGNRWMPFTKEQIASLDLIITTIVENAGLLIEGSRIEKLVIPYPHPGLVDVSLKTRHGLG